MFTQKQRDIPNAAWLMAASAILVHFPLGQAYAFSVFNAPLSKLLGESLTAVGWIFSTAILILGMSAALLGKWVEKVGPRKAILTSAALWFAGFMVAAHGASNQSLTEIILGYGVLGGMGLGIGYISPVSTLIKFFPNRKGLATGIAICGFGGGALVGAPLAVLLMKHFADSPTQGIAEALLALGGIYLVFQLLAAVFAQKPPLGNAPSTTRGISNAPEGASVSEAIRTKPFWLVWTLLLLNVSAGIGILGQASKMGQDMMGWSPDISAGFVGLLSLANLAGRFGWSSLSDKIGRKMAYSLYTGLGALSYLLIAGAANIHFTWGFTLLFVLALSFYGAGFATIPAYLADLFGKKEVGAIHGRLLTAWSAAGVLGPLVVNAGRDALVAQGFSSGDAYSTVSCVLAGILAIAFIVNLSIHSKDSKHADMPQAGMQPIRTPKHSIINTAHGNASTLTLPTLAGAWLLALLPLAWGILQTLNKVAAMFH